MGKRIRKAYAVSLSESEKKLIEEHANSMGLSTSAYIRMLVFKDINDKN